MLLEVCIFWGGGNGFILFSELFCTQNVHVNIDAVKSLTQALT